MFRSTIRHYFCQLFSLLFFVALIQTATADERILSYAVNVDLLANGTADVTEFIEVRGEQENIKRGIFRDLPTVLTKEGGGQQLVKLDVLGVKKDGEISNWFVEKIRNGARIYIGESDILIGTGIFRYEIHYTMDRQARVNAKTPDSAEFYWNVTGNFWNMPINATVATINLPPNSEAGRIAGFTGYAGSSDSEVAITRNSPTQFVVRALRPFSSGEGMTIAVVFNADALDPVTGRQQISNFLSDFRSTIFPIFGVFLVALYYFFAWSSVGRDPEKGTIVPRFYPPKGFSPALTHYVAQMGWKRSGWTAFTAALVSLAVKGHLKFDDTGTDTKFIPLSRRVNNLPSGETLILNFINKTNSVTVDKTDGPAIHKTKAKLLGALQKESRKTYFNNNIGYSIIGALFSILLLIGLSLMQAINFVLIPIALGAGVFVFVLVSLIRGVSGFRAGKSSWLSAVLFPIIGVNILASFGSNFGSGILSNLTPVAPIIATLSIVLLNVIFASIMRAPTVHGRKIMDEIEGFKMYLDTAEKNRLNIHKEPELDPKRFEEILPYAIALGVEKPWSQRFQREFIDVQPTDDAHRYRTRWYSGNGFNSRNIGRNIGSTFAGLSTAMVAAQPASSSSSGFSGGGSVGGGGGGGGGGGW